MITIRVTLFILASLGLFAKSVPLPDVLKPTSIEVDKKQIYITDKQKIHIISLDNYTHKKTFGKSGEGPKEFKDYAFVNSQSEQLVIKSSGKLSHFSKNGEFVKEEKLLSVLVRSILPLDKKYVITENALTGKVLAFSVNLYDSKFQKIKTLFLENNPPKIGATYNNTTVARVGTDKIYIAGYKKLKIDVFDKKGIKLKPLEKAYDLQEFTEKHKKKFLDSYKSNPVTKDFYQGFKNIASFPEYFPAINTFFAADGKLYVQTFREENDKAEFLIFTEDGELLKTVFLPGVCEKFMTPTMYAINNGKLYYLYDNVDAEVWELKAVDID